MQNSAKVCIIQALYFLQIFADFYADFCISIPPHYIANANFYTYLPPHLHYNAEFRISTYKCASWGILLKFAHTWFLSLKTLWSLKVHIVSHLFNSSGDLKTGCPMLDYGTSLIAWLLLVCFQMTYDYWSYNFEMFTMFTTWIPVRYSGPIRIMD